MAANGFLERMIAQRREEESGEVAEQAKGVLRAVEAILSDLVFGLRMLGNHYPVEASLNASIVRIGSEEVSFPR